MLLSMGLALESVRHAENIKKKQQAAKKPKIKEKKKTVKIKTYETRETPGAVWYRTGTGEKYRKSKTTGNWKIISGNLATFTEFLEKNKNIL